MERRSFLKHAGVGLAAGSVAMPAIAQSAPTIKWRMASSFPKSLDTIYGGGEVIAKRVAEATGGKFQIRVFAAGEIVLARVFSTQSRIPPSSAVTPVATTSTARTPPSVSIRRFLFGMTNRQTDAWFRHGNGTKLMGEFFAKSNIVAIPAGNTGVQMGLVSQGNQDRRRPQRTQNAHCRYGWCGTRKTWRCRTTTIGSRHLPGARKGHD